MTTEGLQELGIYAEETAEKVMALFEQLAAEKAVLEGKLEELEAIAEKRTVQDKESAVEKAILEQGGKNAKAIKALLDLEQIGFDGSVLENLDLETVKAAAPYLFYQKEEKLAGTGYQNSSKKSNDITKAFKSALRR